MVRFFLAFSIMVRFLLVHSTDPLRDGAPPIPLH